MSQKLGTMLVWGSFSFLVVGFVNSLVIVMFGEMVAQDGKPAAVGESLHVFGRDFEWRPMGKRVI